MGNKIKVAYVYNFPKFIEWPREKAASARNPFRVCVLGTDPIRTTLGELSIRAIEERPFEVVDVQMGSPMPSCHLLFICRSEAAGLTSILEQVRGLPVLTVSDIPQFALQGGMIGFVTFNEKIKVEINHSLVLRAGLKVRAKLLEIARIVP